MVSQATVYTKVAFGLSKAASKLGGMFDIYRPIGVGPALTVINYKSSAPVFVTSDTGLMAMKANLFGNPIYYAAFDPRLTAVGDYLVGPIVYGLSSGTLTVGGQILQLGGEDLNLNASINSIFFIASQNIPSPIVLVNCNRILFFTQDAPVTKPGVICYGGRTIATDVTLANGWPASILQGTKGEKSVANLPTDTRLPWFNIILPASIPVNFHSGFRLTDDLGNAYIVSSFESTDMGWRLTAALAET